MIQGPICAKVYPEGIQPIKGNSCGLIPVIIIAGRPKAAFLFWFFSDFRRDALLIMVIHVIYKYKNR